MASTLYSIIDLIKRTVSERSSSGTRGGGILGEITEMIGQRFRPDAARRDVRPASEDPYGDPADAKGAKNVRPASEDPYGDPADQKR